MNQENHTDHPIKTPLNPSPSPPPSLLLPLKDKKQPIGKILGNVLSTSTSQLTFVLHAEKVYV